MGTYDAGCHVGFTDELPIPMLHSCIGAWSKRIPEFSTALQGSTGAADLKACPTRALRTPLFQRLLRRLVIDTTIREGVLKQRILL